MFPSAPLTAVLLLVVSVAANPIVVRKGPVSLPFARRLNITGAHDLIQKDQTRARNMFNSKINKRSGTPGSVGITNVAVVYEASVGIGAPATFYTLLVDTGSSNTWIGAGKPYVPTGSSVSFTRQCAVQPQLMPICQCVTYGSGSFCGDPTLIVHGQSIGIASTSTGFQGFDGILGLGPVDLTIGTLSPDTITPIPTITDNLFSQGTMPAGLLSVSFEPTTTTSVKNGELTFGGTDSTQFIGPITTVEFWGIDESIQYGASTTILASTAGILDTGTTLILIATNGFNLYKSATGAVLDANTGLLRITSAQFSNLKSLFFIIGGTAFEFTANAQIWPRSLNTLIGGTSSSIYLVVNDIGTPSGSGLDFINGYTFLERFYTIYDTTNKQVGIAKTPFTTATTN
ncbi:aspartic peptidase A1 [Lactarius sanguifluus]|nr:aspartic peptidase A1 [Lactarius sanguifluus]